MAKINVRGLDAEIAMKGYKLFKPAVQERIDALFARQNNELLEDFNNHPVTQEIQGGATAGNFSGTLGGNGNLFSFLGFAGGSDPISPLRSLLRGSIRANSFRKKRNQLALRLTFSIPTLSTLEAAAPLPWAEGSWARAIENGVSNLGQYLYRPRGLATSRSGTAIQTQNSVRSASSSAPQSYLTGLLGRMERSLESGLKRL